MPIKVDVVDNNSTVRVRPEDNTSTVKLSSGNSIDIKRLEILVEQLQKTKQDLGFINLNYYVEPSHYYGVIPHNVLNLLKTYLINKVSYDGSIYSLNRISEPFYDYVCDNIVLNTVRINIESGRFELMGIQQQLNHDELNNLDYLHSGHTGFAGIEFGTTEYWTRRGDYVPPSGMIVVYTDYGEDEQGNLIPGIKIGDGNAPIIDKQFVGGDILDALEEHIRNVNLHVSDIDRENWDQKLDEPSVDDVDKLVFTINKYK